MASKDLEQAFKLGQTNIELPDVTIKLGSYEWRVHSQLLKAESAFFEAALKNTFKVGQSSSLPHPSDDKQEGTTRCITIHDDDPLIFARVIQYLYSSNYQTMNDGSPYAYYTQGTATLSLSLETIMANYKDDSAFTVAEIEDRDRADLKIDCMMVILADKYAMPHLMKVAAEKFTYYHDLPGYDLRRKQNFWLCHQLIGEDRIANHEVLQDVFAKIAGEHFVDLDDGYLREWCQKDPKLGYKILQYMGAMLSEAQQALEDEREYSRQLQKASSSPRKRRKA